MSTEAAIQEKYNVQIIHKPSDEATISGITVFLPGTMLNYKDYVSIYNVLLEKNQIIIAFRSMNPFFRNHEQMAQDVVNTVQELRELPIYNHLPEKYNLVGHSLGGKVSLMVAAKFDIENVSKVIALDPVDDRPQEITYPQSMPTTNLNNSKAEQLHLFQSEKGGDGWFGFFPLCPKDKNATVIQSMYPDKITSFEMNIGAGHMSYLDKQNDDASVKARADVHAKIRKVI